MKAIFLCLSLMLLGFEAAAKSYGVIGSIYPVEEQSMLSMIEDRLKVMNERGDFEAINQAWLKRAAEHTNRPTPLNLERAKISSSHLYNPSIRLGEDIRDYKGHLLYAKGTTVNALERLPFYKPCWLFFDGDNEAQVRFAEKQLALCSNPKIILTGGAIKDAEGRFNQVIYFDQAGRLTKKLNITHLPSRVTRHGLELLIEEFAIKESGDVI